MSRPDDRHALKLVAITEGPGDPKRRELRLQKARLEAWEALVAALQRAGLMKSDYDDSTPVGRLARALWKAHEAETTCFKGRVLRLEHTLRGMLMSDQLSDQQRDQVVISIYGERGRGKNPALYSATEQQLIVDYRQLDPAARMLARTLFGRLLLSSGKVEAEIPREPSHDTTAHDRAY